MGLSPIQKPEIFTVRGIWLFYLAPNPLILAKVLLLNEDFVQELTV